MDMKLSLLALILGFIVDLFLGDPAWIYHPIRLVGNLIAVLEKRLNLDNPGRMGAASVGKGSGTGHDRANFLRGMAMALAVMALSAGIPLALLMAAQRIHPYLRLALETVFCWQLLATKSLRDESMKVYDKLKEHDLPGSRRAVSMIVGRDTEVLDETGVTKAAVETVAENASDGVIAPMFYMAIGGAVLGFLYKSINTMDSMVGYTNSRYRHFGTFAAKLDDVVNYIPARLSALFMIAASALCGTGKGSGTFRYSAKNAWRIFRRDRYKHASPNSAQTEAVMAGALGVQLAGDAWYFGELHKKEFIGDPLRPVEAEDIPRANRLLYATAALALAVLALGKCLCILCGTFCG